MTFCVDHHPIVTLDYNERSVLLSILTVHQAVMATRDDLVYTYRPTTTLRNMLNGLVFEVTDAVLEYCIIFDHLPQEALRQITTTLANSLTINEPDWLDDEGCHYDDFQHADDCELNDDACEWDDDAEADWYYEN
jgi:hypothetical protein